MDKLEIHLVDLTETNVDVFLDSKYLTEKDRNSFDRYKNPETKNEKIVSTYFKNRYIGDYHLNEYEKPISDNCFFNISHSHGLIAFIKSDKPIGIDIEKIREVDPKLVDYVTSKKEKQYITNEKTFYEVWTSKESLVKAVGTGIKNKINEIESLPINGTKVYEEKKYTSQTISVNGFIICVTREGKEEFSLEIIKEVL